MIDPLEPVIDELVRSGYDVYFHADGDQVGCPDCEHLVHVDELRVDKVVRLPVIAGDQWDEMLVFAVSGGPCGRRGLFTTARKWTIDASEHAAERSLLRRLDED